MEKTLNWFVSNNVVESGKTELVKDYACNVCHEKTNCFFTRQIIKCPTFLILLNTTQKKYHPTIEKISYEFELKKKIESDANEKFMTLKYRVVAISYHSHHKSTAHWISLQIIPGKRSLVLFDDSKIIRNSFEIHNILKDFIPMVYYCQQILC